MRRCSSSWRSARPSRPIRTCECFFERRVKPGDRDRLLPEFGRSPRQQRKTRNVPEVVGIHGNKRRAMDQRLSSDHTVQQSSARIPDRLDDLPIRIGSCVIECEDGQRRQSRIESWPTNSGLGRVPIDAPFELGAADDREKDRTFQRRDTRCDAFVTVAQMNRNVGVQQIGQGQSPDGSGSTASSRTSISEGRFSSSSCLTSSPMGLRAG